MVFSSIIFLIYFFPIFLLTYHTVPQKLKNGTLLLFSTVFYAWGAPTFILYLIASTIANFLLVKKMHEKSGNEAKVLLGISIAINLGLLCYFKYANFFMENVNAIRSLFGATSFAWESVVLPIGISFFTFQSITYSLDVYRKVHEPLSNPFDYMLFIMMFPQMIAGPIVRFIDIADQIKSRKEIKDELLYGFYRFGIGLGKKVLIADILAVEVNKILGSDFEHLDSSHAWIGIIGYTFQLYFDFAGYSDMAIGIGRMIGFKFPENFDNPYIARSVTEFWRRWHMTFSVFMRNYLYYPLGGSRVESKFRLYFNLWVVFLLSGLWHGASWNFVIYGAFHGFFLVLERLFLIKFLDKIGQIPSILFTFFIVVMARVFFRLESFDEAIHFFSVLFSFNFVPLNISDMPFFYFAFVIAIFFSFITLSKYGLIWQDRIYNMKYTTFGHIRNWSLTFTLIVLSLASLTGSGFSPFIYFRF